MQNLTLSNDPARVGKVIELSESLGLSEVINRLPKGYETLIGGKGATPLPEGTLQLIAFIRALSMSPKVLLFNEANTSMDDRTDNATLSMLSDLRGKTTLVLVSRRPSYVAIADRQINLTEHGATIRRLNDLDVVLSKPDQGTNGGQGQKPTHPITLNEPLNLAEASS